MKACTAITVAAILWICGAPAGVERTDGTLREAAAAETPNVAEGRWIKAQREGKLRVMKKTDRAAIVWGNEKRPNGTIVFRLDPPLRKVKGRAVVEVELFSASVDDDGWTELHCRARDLALRTWWPSIEKAGLPVWLAHRQIDQGAGLDSPYHESRRAISELIVGGAWYANNGDERGVEVVRRTMERLRADERLREITRTDVEEILTGAGIDAGHWREETREEVEAVRAMDNSRWEDFAVQYLKWVGNRARLSSRLGRGAAPILVIDGKYLVTMNTIWRQGGRRAPERVFQTANSLIRHRMETNPSGKAETGENDKEEKTMNYTAAALATAIALGGACGSATNEAAAGEYPNWQGMWELEISPAEVLPDAAHIRMESGTVLRILGLRPIEDPEDAQIARKGMEKILEGKKARCLWPKKPAEEGNPMAVTEQGHPIASCMARDIPYARCPSDRCKLGDRAISAGYGIPDRGAWEKRSKGAAGYPARLSELEAKAKEYKLGIWSD